MKKILILFAHPALEKSRINKQIIADLDNLENVTFRDLYELYPDFNIDVQEEQQLLLEHDIIIFQHPFYWYSTPAILKEWQDLVLEHGWAYGSEGKALAGKWLMNAMTAGGGKESYNAEGFNQYTIREFLQPIERTAILCKMHYLAPMVLHGTHSCTTTKVTTFKAQYLKLLKRLVEDELPLSTLQSAAYMNDLFKGDGNDA
ncbi:MAG: NAD(P)H-dependent oxidoreductase [Calditrichia bacterium]